MSSADNAQWTDALREYDNIQQQCNYRKTSSISRTKSLNIDVSNLVLQLSLLNPLKPGVKSRMKMLQLHQSYRQFYCLSRCDLY